MTLFGQAIVEQSPELPLIHVVAYCHDCRRQHAYREPYWLLRAAQFDWIAKHAGHNVSFRQPSVIYPTWFQRFLDKMAAKYRWPAYELNADNKIAYVASAAYTMALEGTPLASSATRVVGRESTAVSNSSNYIDMLVSAKITVGTTPTVATQIDLGVVAALDDTPTWPDVFDGTDSDETITSVEIRDAIVKIPLEGQLIVNATTSNRNYFVAPFSIAAQFGYQMPKDHVLWCAHSTVAALNSTGSNHVVKRTPVYRTI